MSKGLVAFKESDTFFNLIERSERFGFIIDPYPFTCLYLQKLPSVK